MRNEVKDPLGNIVFAVDDICANQQDQANPYIYDDIATVVSKPALLIEAVEDSQLLRYYFRSMGWNHTFLIITQFVNKTWRAKSCIQDPLDELLVEIMKKGEKLL